MNGTTAPAMAEQALATILERLTLGQEALQRQQHDHSVLMTGLVEAVQRAAAPRPEQRRAVEAKGLGRPVAFTGAMEDWPSWSFQFATWFGSQFREAGPIFDAIQRDTASEITDEVLEEYRTEGTDVDTLDSQLFTCLVCLMRQGSESMELVRNARAKSGLDAWRRLCGRYEPTSPQANLLLLRKVLQPSRATTSTFVLELEKWERALLQYQERSSETLGEATKLMVLLSLCPKVLQEHLELNMSRLTTYATMRQEAVRYVETHLSRSASSSANQGAVPMEIGSLKGAGKSAGKKSRKGSASPQMDSGSAPRFEGTCYTCGRVGHRASECRSGSSSKGKGRGKSSPSPPAKGKVKGKSKGKGKASSSSGGKSKGKRKGLRSLEEGDGEWPDEEWTEGAEVPLGLLCTLGHSGRVQDPLGLMATATDFEAVDLGSNPGRASLGQNAATRGRGASSGVGRQSQQQRERRRSAVPIASSPLPPPAGRGRAHSCPGGARGP